MRLVFGLYVLFIGLQALPEAQAQSTSPVLTLPLDEALPDEFWRFHTGHNPAWASPAYDDKHWVNSAPTTSLLQNKSLWQAGQGWFRLPIRISAQQLGQQLRLSVEQFGSTEWYLDGRRLATLKPSTTQRTIQSLSFQLADTNQHLLAIHYRFRPEPVYYAATSQAPFDMRVFIASQADQVLALWYRLVAGISFFIVSVFALLGMLHLLFYRANPTQSVNQWLGAAMLALSLSSLVDSLGDFPVSLTMYSLISLVSVLTCYLGFGLLLTAVYRYLNQPLEWSYRLLLGSMFISFFYSVWIDDPSNSVVGGLFIVFLADYIRASWLGKRQADADARLPWKALKVAFYALSGIPVILGILIVVGLKGNVDLFVYMTLLLVAVAILCIPLGFSLFLVSDYARTHQALRLNLRQVEQLSAQTLAQEQEKQQLLAQQNQTLEQQVQQRTAALEESLDELHRTQDQLIQREKLASLGELTAGIAHEIQNPLNFVNNFSQVSVELLEELRQEDVKASRDRDLVDELLGDLEQNLHRISQHGGRASAIVNGMLEHSRISTGERQPTDLNALCEESLHLAYHGLQISDKSFQCELLTDFAPHIGKVPVVAPELGRVFLNLFNNAFYAARQKWLSQAHPGYQPKVQVITNQEANFITIQICDNGMGMPESIQQKVFQPFFTTKPAGQGTGLGLSLSYDIVTKGHGGHLSVSSQEGEGTIMAVRLPLRG